MSQPSITLSSSPPPLLSHSPSMSRSGGGPRSPRHSSQQLNRPTTPTYRPSMHSHAHSSHYGSAMFSHSHDAAADSDPKEVSLRHRHTVDELAATIDISSMIDDKPLSGSFDELGIPTDEDDVKKQPKKVREYYEFLATLKGHYEEVDELLASSVPQNIATSFRPPKSKMTRSSSRHSVSSRHSIGSRRGQDGPDHTLSNGYSIQDAAEGGDGNGADEETALLGDDDDNGMQERQDKRDRLNKLALDINFAINLLLLLGKGGAVLSSSSISLVASFVDSALDFLSTLIILGTSLMMGRKGDAHLYPAGKRRFEPLGVLIFAVAMIASFIQVFIESFQRAIGKSQEPADLSWIGIGTMVATIVIKSVVWFWCSRIPSSSVKALAQDAENDVVFNLMSLAFPWIGGALKWRLLDPIGGMVLSTYIIYEWIKTLSENFANLSGKSASPDQIARVLYLVSRFRAVEEIPSVECYHIGDDLIVECDVILPKDTSMAHAHDIGETIQCCLESLDHVARAYVHVDYNSENPAQHTSRPAKNGGLRVTSSPSNTTPSTPTVVQSPSGGAGEADGKSKA